MSHTPPRQPDAAELERWIVARLSRELGIPAETFDADADFTALGVDSVTLAGMFGELEKRTGRPLDPYLLTEYPNARALARFLGRGEA
ncbi:MAG: acyl carrier protein [Elusimicrobia bacterium]|nr:acyl carrier protein [Elusimicrobiota bacterium]